MRGILLCSVKVAPTYHTVQENSGVIVVAVR